MKRKTVRKITNAVLLCSFIMLLISTILHEAVPKHAFMMMHVIPEVFFTVSVLIHLNINNYPFRKRHYNKTDSRANPPV